MIVTTISATIRYSQDTGKGAWKVIELGAEASISDREFWKQAQSELYYQLGDQLRQLWHYGNGAALNGHDGTESPVEPLPETAPVSGSGSPPEHWCPEHQTAFIKRNGNGGESWWSHKAPDGSWCRE